MALTLTAVATAGNAARITWSGASGTIRIARGLASATVTDVEDAIEDGTLTVIRTENAEAGTCGDAGLTPETARGCLAAIAIQPEEHVATVQK